MTNVIVMSILFCAYLLGSISPSILIAKSKGIKINTFGSKNAGATNTMRALGFKTALLVLFLDFIKAFAPVFVTLHILPSLIHNSVYLSLLVLCAIVLGHIYPIYFKFKGGKGVACLAGGVFAILPFEATIATLFFIIVLFVGRTVSIASLSITIFLPVFYIIYNKHNLNLVILSFLIIAGIFVLFTHRGNIKRLLQGTEPKTF